MMGQDELVRVFRLGSWKYASTRTEKQKRGLDGPRRLYTLTQQHLCEHQMNQSALSNAYN